MYKKYFRLQTTPFSIAPDPRYLFMSPQHREALAHLIYGVSDSGGFVALTGEVGTGKTTLWRCLIDHLPNDVDIALIFNPRLSAIELLCAICDELKIPYSGSSLKYLIDVLNKYLLSAHAQGRRTVLIIDEAQNLSLDVLEQIRLLTNLETTHAKLLQIILIGQTELRNFLARHELRQLNQRITVRYHLSGLSASETAAYIRHRLSVGGGDAQLFTVPAMRKIHRISRGIPRIINIVCDRALLGAYTNGLKRVDAKIVGNAAREVLRPPRPSWLSWRSFYSGLAVGLFCLLATGGVYLAQTRGPSSMLSAGPADPVEAASSTEPAPRVRAESIPYVGDEVVSVSEFGEIETSIGFETTDGVEGEARASEVKAEVPEAVAAKVEVPGEQAPEVEVLKAKDAEVTAPEVEEPKGPAPEFAKLILDPSLNVESAFAASFAQWGLDPDPVRENNCKGARRYGFRCLVGHGTWDQMQAFNRPAVLEFTLESGQKRYASLVKLGQSGPTLDLGGRQQSFPLADALALWQGQFAILWRPPIKEVEMLRPGNTSPAVGWLREQLSLFDGSAAGVKQVNYFDRELQKRVVAFQANKGLVQDGVVGPQTFIHLNNLNNFSGIPRLVKD